MIQLPFQIHRKNGLHVRIGAALIAKLQELLGDKRKNELPNIFIEYNGKQAQVCNLIALTSLRIKQGDTFKLLFPQQVSPSHVKNLHDFFTNTDPDDLKQAETDRLLIESSHIQERLHLVLESVSDSIALTDELGHFTYVNDHMATLLTSLDKKATIHSFLKTAEWRAAKQTSTPIMRSFILGKNGPFLSKISPVFVDGDFTGVVLTLTPHQEIKKLHKKIDMMEERTKYLEQELTKHLKLDDSFQAITGTSEILLETLALANKVAKTTSTILITGESGTGKELVARAVHLASNRQHESFIRVNCAAIPPNLIESELFGHEKGAFTGADKLRRGKFELAQHGTIFLDEIGDLSLELQVKLLRVLQEREIERVGGMKTIPLDVRVIAATHQDLRSMVEQGTFREDLYYRLNVIPVHLPPLRKRKEDIPLLVDHFRIRFSEQLGKRINGYESGFIAALGRYHWPGNIRELQNILERVCAVCDDDTLKLKDLPSYILGSPQGDRTIFSPTGALLTMEEYEKQIYAYAAPLFPSYNQLGQALGVTHKTVASKLKKYQLEELLGKKYQPT